MRVIDVPAKDGLRWIRDAFALFRERPAVWFSLIAAWFGLWLVALLFQVVGIAIMSLLSPAFLAGLMVACRDQTIGKTITVAHLFAALKENARPLLTLGAIMLLVETSSSLVFGAMGLPNRLPTGANGLPDVVALRAMFSDHAGIFFLAFVFSVAVTAIFWFAAPLLALKKMPVSHALRWSFFACLSNIAPMLVFGATMFVLAMIATMPMLIGWVILVPVFLIANYTSYLRVFSDDDGARAESPTRD